MGDKNRKDGQECSCYAESRKACPRVQNVTHPLRYYEFTDDEIRALEECDKESFYRRCLPFSAVLASATYAAVKTGYLTKSPHFGAVPKVLLALAAGHAVGRVVYSPHCDAKLRALPADSKLGEIMRKYHKADCASAKK